MTQALPAPPESLPDLIEGDLTVLPAGALLARVHDLSGRCPTAATDLRHYGPLAGRGRFDHHPSGPPGDHGDHGVLYAATSLHPGGRRVLDLLRAEQVQDGRTLELTPTTTLSVLELADPLELLDVCGQWGQRTRAGTHLATAPHEDVQPWARAIHRRYLALVGIMYRPATGGHEHAVALNERAGAALAATRLMFQEPLASRALERPLAGAAKRLDLVIRYP